MILYWFDIKNNYNNLPHSKVFVIHKVRAHITRAAWRTELLLMKFEPATSFSLLLLLTNNLTSWNQIKDISAAFSKHVLQIYRHSVWRVNSRRKRNQSSKMSASMRTCILRPPTIVKQYFGGVRRYHAFASVATERLNIFPYSVHGKTLDVIHIYT